jgi:hypothetical protein
MRTGLSATRATGGALILRPDETRIEYSKKGLLVSDDREAMRSRAASSWTMPSRLMCSARAGPLQIDPSEAKRGVSSRAISPRRKGAFRLGTCARPMLDVASIICSV